MESSAPASSRHWLNRWGGGLLAALVLALYAGLLIRHVDACAGGSDSSGYMNHARLLGSGRLHTAPRELPGLDGRHFSEFLYVPLGFVPKDGSLVPTYPVGMPLMILAVHVITGWVHAGDAVIVFNSLAAIVLLFALGRAVGLGRGWCALAAGILALSPLFLDFSLQAMSDVPALAWTAATALAVWLARRRLGWAAAAGFIFAVSVLIRPTNILMIAPLVIAWWPDRWDRGESRRLLQRIGLFGAGGLPAAIGFAVHSHAAYGQWLTTGYGDASSLFMRSMIGLTLRHYVKWLPVVFSPAVWLFLALPWSARRNRAALFLLVWGLVYLAFYVSYFHTHEDWWYLRFVLPAAPAFILGPLWVVRSALSHGAERLKALRYLPSALFACGMAWAVQVELRWDRQFQVLSVGHGEASYRMVMNWLKVHAAPNSVLTVMQASGAAFYYTDFIAVRWDQMSPSLFPEVAAAAAKEGRAIYAPLFPFETESALQERMPGQWEPVGKIREIVIWRWAGSPPPR